MEWRLGQAMARRIVYINPGDQIDIRVIQDPELPRNKSEWQNQISSFQENALLTHVGHRRFDYVNAGLRFDFDSSSTTTPKPVQAGGDALAFHVRVARLLAELHGEETLSEQQCAKIFGIDLPSWREVEHTCSRGTGWVESIGDASPMSFAGLTTEDAIRAVLHLGAGGAASGTPEQDEERHTILGITRPEPCNEVDALRDMLSDARGDLDSLREALGVSLEPHQSLLERMLATARKTTGYVGTEAPIAWRTVVAAIRAVDGEASRRGKMFPQTSDEQEDDRKAVRRVAEMIEWYATSGGAVAEKLVDWPRIAVCASLEAGSTGQIDGTIAELRRLEAAATKGPWTYQENSDAYTHILRSPHAAGTYVVAFPQGSKGQSEPDARFVAAMRSGMPVLLSALAGRLVENLNGELSALRERAAAPQAESGSAAHATDAAGGKDRDRALFESAYVAHMNSQAIHRRTGMRDYTVEEISALRSGDHYNAGTDSRDGYLNGCWRGWQTRGAAAPADATQLMAEHVVDPATQAVAVPGSTLDPVAEALSVGKAEIMQRIPSVARLYVTGLGARRYRRASTQTGPGEPLVHRSHVEREIHRLLIDLINVRSAMAQATLARVFSPSVVDALESISQQAHAAHGLGGERHMEITLSEVADRLLVIVEEHRGGAGLRESRPA